MSGKIESARNCAVSVGTQIQAADRLGLVWSGDRIYMEARNCDKKG